VRGVLVGAPGAAGASFGEPALMHGSPRAATARARGDYVLRRLPGHCRRLHAAAGGDCPGRPLGGPDFFGEKALMSEDVRRATCVAAAAKYLVRRLGNPQDLLDGPHRRPPTT